MKTSRIAGYVGAGLLAVSCNMQKPATTKALEHASKYLTGTELVVAEGRASKITKESYTDYSGPIFYWDSLLSVNREKEFYEKGKQHVKDSVAGKYNRKPLFQMPLKPDESQKAETIRDSVKKLVSHYYSGYEMLKLEQKEPPTVWTKYGVNRSHVTQYYGSLGIAGAERKGFQEGLAAERKNIKNNK